MTKPRTIPGRWHSPPDRSDLNKKPAAIRMAAGFCLSEPRRAGISAAGRFRQALHSFSAEKETFRLVDHLTVDRDRVAFDDDPVCGVPDGQFGGKAVPVARQHRIDEQPVALATDAENALG